MDGQSYRMLTQQEAKEQNAVGLEKLFLCNQSIDGWKVSSALSHSRSCGGDVNMEGQTPHWSLTGHTGHNPTQHNTLRQMRKESLLPSPSLPNATSLASSIVSLVWE